MSASLLILAAACTGVAPTPAYGEANHTLSFVSHNLDSTQPANNHLLQAGQEEASGHTVGYSASTCTLEVPTRSLSCHLAEAQMAGMLYADFSISTKSGVVNGTVTGGTGAYNGASGTVSGHPGTHPNYVDITIVYHT
jgi:hypothetical protein